MNQFYATLATVLCFGVLTPSPSTSMLQDSTVQVGSSIAVLLPSKDVQPMTTRQVVAYYLKQNGSPKQQRQCAMQIAYDESRFHIDSVNKETGAHGVFQLIQSKQYTRLSKHVQKATQYMEHRYGTWCKANQFHEDRGWW